MSIKNIFVGILKFVLHVFLLMLVGALSTFITLRLFTAGDEVKVPKLIGEDPTKAIQVLAREGLQLKILPQKRYSNTVAAERIVAQQPVAETKIKRGRSVEVYISLGPEKVVVPDLIGQTRRVAVMMLNQRGLQEGKIISVYSSDAEEDQILAQYPVSGTEMTGNRSVDILVNSSRDGGQVFVMPDVIGKPISEVTQYFKQAGLRISSSLPIDYPEIPSGTIVKQAPPAGYKVSKWDFIGLYYSR